MRPPDIPTRLLPMRALVGREFLLLLRQRRSILTVATCVAVAAIVLASAWPPPGQMQLAYYAMASKDVSALFVVFLFGFFALFLPGLASATLISDRSAGVIDELVMAGITPSQFLIAKAVNSAGLLLLILVAILPVASGVYFGVGTDTTLVAAVTLLLIVVAVSITMTALALTAKARGPVFSVVAGTVAAAFLAGWFSILVVLATEMRLIEIAGDKLINAFAYVFPLFATMKLMEGRSNAINVAAITSLLACCAVHLTIAGLAFAVARRQLRSAWNAVPGSMPKSRFRSRHASRATSAALNFSHAKNPVFLLELNVELRRNHFRTVLASSALLLAASAGWLWLALRYLVTNNTVLLMDAIIGIFVLMQFVVPLALIPYCVHLITKEYERQHMDSLLMSLLGSWAILAGKLRSVAWVVIGIVSISTIAALPILLIGLSPRRVYELELTWRRLEIVGMGLGTLFVCCALACACAFLASMFTRRLGTGIVTANTLYVFLSIGAFIAITPVFSGGRIFSRIRDQYSPDFWLNAFSPILTFVECSDYVSSAGIIWRLWLITMGVHLALCVAILRVAHVLFVRWHVHER